MNWELICMRNEHMGDRSFLGERQSKRRAPYLRNSPSPLKFNPISRIIMRPRTLLHEQLDIKRKLSPLPILWISERKRTRLKRSSRWYINDTGVNQNSNIITVGKVPQVLFSASKLQPPALRATASRSISSTGKDMIRSLYMSPVTYCILQRPPVDIWFLSPFGWLLF